MESKLLEKDAMMVTLLMVTAVHQHVSSKVVSFALSMQLMELFVMPAFLTVQFAQMGLLVLNATMASATVLIIIVAM